LPTEVAATATTTTHPTCPAHTVAPSQVLKRKRGNGASKMKIPPPITLRPESPPTHRTTPLIPQTIDKCLSPLTDEDEEATGQTLPNSKESAQSAGTANIDQEPQTDGEDSDEVPPPPKKRRITTGSTQSRGGAMWSKEETLQSAEWEALLSAKQEALPSAEQEAHSFVQPCQSG